MSRTLTMAPSVFLLLVALPVVAVAAGNGPPPAAKRPVTDTYSSTKVQDDYRWLENWSDPEVKAWSNAQNAYARTWLDARPGRAELGKRLNAIMRFEAPSYRGIVSRAGVFFASKFAPPKQQRLLVQLTAFDPATEKVIVDPNALDPSGLTAIDFFVPSTDGRRVAVSLSKGGSERGDVSIYDVATGKALPDVIPHVNNGTAGGSVAWNADSTGFWYTRYPSPGERPEADLDFFQQVWFHKLGTKPEADTYAIGKDFPRIAEIVLSTTEDGRYVLARVANGDGGEFATYLLPPGGSWIAVSTFADKIVRAEFGRDNALWLLSRKGAPKGQLLRLPLDQPQLDKARVVIPQRDGVVSEYLPVAGTVYVSYLVGGPSELRAFGLDGKELGLVKTPPVSGVDGLVSPKGDDLYLAIEQYTVPRAWYHFDTATRALSITKLAPKSPVDFSNLEVVRETATSKDGTKVPLTILRRRGTKLDGNNPTLLYGYGGYGINETPGFDPELAPWFEHGGVYAVANIRGGGEFGEDWHLAGNLLKKQNVFDDFIACARRLIELKITNPKRLAIEGGSNGGLLMGAAFTQAPDLFRAVVSHVGIYDMLRVELQPNGAFNVTEFGTVKDPAQFKAMYAYSPYHHVVDGTKYPALMLLTGANDPRVDPLHSRKFAARVQAASTSGLPVLLRTTDKAGHGIGSSLDERIAQAVDVDAFLFDQLGM